MRMSIKRMVDKGIIARMLSVCGLKKESKKVPTEGLKVRLSQ
jgi:hypothetical protein